MKFFFLTFSLLFTPILWKGGRAEIFAQGSTIDSLLTLLKKDKEDTNKVNHLNALGRKLMYQNPDTAIILGNQAIRIITPVSSPEFTSTNNQPAGKGIRDLQAKTLGQIGTYYYLKANYSMALDYYMNALKIDDETKNRNGMAMRFGNIGLVYYRQGDYPKALEYYFKASKIDEELGNKDGVAAQFANTGNIYWDQGNYPKALNYYFKALKIDEGLGNKNRIAVHFCNIGNVYYSQGEYPKALEYYFKSLKAHDEFGDKNGIAIGFGNIGSVYNSQGDYPKAMDYYFKALKIDEKLGNKNGVAIDFCNIGELYMVTGKFKEAEHYLKKALALNNSIGALNDLREVEEALAYLYDTTGHYKKALIHYKKAIALKDTIFNQENKKQLIRKEMNYEFEKREAATKATHDKEMAVAEAEKKKQQFAFLLVSCSLLLVFLFAGFIFRSLRITRKQKNIIELQKNVVSEQKEIVEKQKEKIVDSITYAQRIQQSILMEESEMKNYLPNSFIYYQPKDIVSGDFYWCSKIDDKIIIAAIDCTGHGVPGAFMSMIGNTLLNQIVNEKHITTPSEILRLLNIGIYEALHQKKEGALSRDGMDAALCCIDYKKQELQYAGAQNPLYVMSDNELIVIKADNQTVGGGGLIPNKGDAMKLKYTNHTIPIKKDICVYLFSDGYSDQFGYSSGKKFGTQRFKELLLSIQQLSMQKQKELIASAHIEWKGNTTQIDDILVIGVKI